MSKTPLSSVQVESMQAFPRHGSSLFNRIFQHDRGSLLLKHSTQKAARSLELCCDLGRSLRDFESPVLESVRRLALKSSAGATAALRTVAAYILSQNASDWVRRSCFIMENNTLQGVSLGGAFVCYICVLHLCTLGAFYGGKVSLFITRPYLLHTAE